MKEFTFSYTTTYYFEQPVMDHAFTIKCLPDTRAGQNITDIKTELSQTDFCSEGRDAFGNRMFYGMVKRPHDQFHYRVTGQAVTDVNKRDTDDRYVDLFLQQTGRTKPGKELLRRAEELRAKLGDINKTEEPGSSCKPTSWRYDTINHLVHKMLAYTPDATTVETTAEEALTLGVGVCQDYAHIMLSILRELHIPCRYVVGMMQGEGSSHAWVEVWQEGATRAWYGYDPTNDKAVDDGYIKISHGRDYADCMVMRGIYRGTSEQTQEVHVCVW